MKSVVHHDDPAERSEDNGFAGKNLDVNAENGFGDVAGRFETVGAEARSQLLFGLSMKTAMALETSGVLRQFNLFADVNFGMDFEGDHFLLPGIRRGKRRTTFCCADSLKI